MASNNQVASAGEWSTVVSKAVIDCNTGDSSTLDSDLIVNYLLSARLDTALSNDLLRL